MSQMKKFKEYLDEHGITRFDFASDDQPWHDKCGTNYFSLTFTDATVRENPNTIYFRCNDGVFAVDSVRKISYTEFEDLSCTLISVTCGVVGWPGDERVYQFIAR